MSAKFGRILEEIYTHPTEARHTAASSFINGYIRGKWEGIPSSGATREQIVEIIDACRAYGFADADIFHGLSLCQHMGYWFRYNLLEEK